MDMKSLLQHNSLWGLAAVALFLLGITTLYRPVAEHSVWRLSGDFDNVGDLKIGSDVMLSGFSVGTVESLELQPDLKVRVTILLKEGLEVPDDSDLRIQTTGLFNAPNLTLNLGGGGFDLLEDGDQIAYTQSSVDFIRLFEQIVTHANRPEDPVQETPS